MTGLFLHGIAHLTTNDTKPTSDAVVVVTDGFIEYAGPAVDAPAQGQREGVDCSGRSVLPGFVDSHTHLVFAGDRSDEFARRLAGESYSDIARRGGGILATVTATRSAAEDDLFELAAARVRRMIAAGTTTVEIKSGYGLDLETEMKILRVAARIGSELPVTVKTTFLGAHSVPPEYRDDRAGYLEAIVGEMLPRVAGHADFCDVFVEDGVFDTDEARTVLEAAKRSGMDLRVHAEQLTRSGGAALAAELGASSADHLDHVTEDDARALATAGVSAVLVPGASFSLRSPQAPGRMLWDAGCTVALATDCNPGTSYFESMGLVISLAVVEMGLDIDQAIWAATRGGALSLGLEDRGRLRAGDPADLIVLDAPSPAHIAYRPATPLVWATVKDGEWAHRSAG